MNLRLLMYTERWVLVEIVSSWLGLFIIECLLGLQSAAGGWYCIRSAVGENSSPLSWNNPK